MTRIMYDSTTAGDIPPRARMVAGYVDGAYRNVAELHRRFPNARLVTITVTGTAGADVCDTEPGNITPHAAALWAAREVRAGRKPTIYCMASQWATVRASVKSYGVAGKVSYWIAQYDGKPVIPAGAVAKQYLHGDLAVIGSFAYSGGHHDVSVVADHWPGVDPTPPLRHRTRDLAKRLRRRLARRHAGVGAGRRVLRRLRRVLRRLLAK